MCNTYNSESTDKIAPVQIMLVIYYGLLLILLSFSLRKQSSNLSDYPIVYTPIILKLVSTAAGIIPYYKAFGLQKLVINKNLKNSTTARSSCNATLYTPSTPGSACLNI